MLIPHNAELSSYEEYIKGNKNLLKSNYVWNLNSIGEKVLNAEQVEEWKLKKLHVFQAIQQSSIKTSRYKNWGIVVGNKFIERTGPVKVENSILPWRRKTLFSLCGKRK